MPELPEVETLRRELAGVLVGKTIKAVKILWPGSIAPLSPAAFSHRIKNRQIKSVNRRAKILILTLQDSTLKIPVEPSYLLIHLKMTGQLVYCPQGSALKIPKVEPLIIGGHPEDPTKYTRVIFTFTDNSRALFNDLRKFGWLKILSAKRLAQIHEQHGLEPLSAEFALENFVAALKRYPNRPLKQNLLNQALVAGLGNIYADEVCFAAEVRPARRVKTLTAAEFKKLHRSIKQVLQLALKKGGTSIRDYRKSDGRPGGFVPHLKVYARFGQPCKNCLTPIKKIQLAARGTHFCPRCQR